MLQNAIACNIASFSSIAIPSVIALYAGRVGHTIGHLAMQKLLFKDVRTDIKIGFLGATIDLSRIHKAKPTDIGAQFFLSQRVSLVKTVGPVIDLVNCAVSAAVAWKLFDTDVRAAQIFSINSIGVGFFILLDSLKDTCAYPYMAQQMQIHKNTVTLAAATPLLTSVLVNRYIHTS